MLLYPAEISLVTNFPAGVGYYTYGQAMRFRVERGFESVLSSNKPNMLSSAINLSVTVQGS